MSDDAPSESDLRFGQMVVSQGFVTPEQVRECLRLRFELQSHGGHKKPAPRLSEILVGKGYITAEQCERVMRSRTTSIPLVGESKTARHELPAEAADAAQIPGNVLGRYVRVRKLGEGGMGEVWRAWDRDLQRWVALKFLRVDNITELARFQREAQTVAKLSHPNIASIYDVGEHNGRPYIAMQYIEGPTLNSFPGSDLPLLVRLMRDACHGVHHAHENGVIHRDLKPQNIIVEGKVTPGSKSTRSLKSLLSAPAFRPYVVDFGLAKETAVRTSTTVAGNTVGTPPYMSPEQVRGAGEMLDVRSDVYSLGATLYEVCAGRPPFKSEDPYDLFKMIVERDPPPVRSFNPAVEPDLENIILRCLEKEPARRYASALELAEDLERYLEGEPVLAKSAGMGYRLRKRMRKNVALSMALLGVLVAVGIGVFLIVHRSFERQTEEDARRIVLEAAELSRRAQESVKEAKALWRIRGSSRAQWEPLLREAETLANAALEKHPGLASGHYTLGEIRQCQSSWSEGARSFERAITYDPTMPGAWYRLGLCNLELYTETMFGAGVLEISLPENEAYAWRRARAEPHQKAAVAAFRRYSELKGVNEESSPLLRCSQAAIAIAEGRYEEAEGICSDILGTVRTDEQVWLLKAMALCSRKDYAHADEVLHVLINDVMPQLAQAHYLVGWIQEKQKDFPKAAAACSRALDLNPTLVSALVTRAWARCGMNDEPGMVEDATRAIALDPGCAPAYYARAWARERAADMKGAVDDYGKIIGLHPNYAPVYEIRGWALERMESYAQSLADYAKVVSLGGKEPHDFANCGRVRSQMGDHAGALEEYSRALERTSKEAGLFVERGHCYLALKKFDCALQDFRAALKLDAKLQPTLAPLIAQCEGAR